MRPTWFLPLLLLAAVAVLGHAAGPAPVVVAGDDAPALHRDLVYATADGTPLTLHLARPAGAKGPLPTVLLLHGGGWTRGRKEQLEGLALFLAREGFLAATAAYRLAPRHPWPAQIQDCRAAVRWLRGPAGAAHGVDPGRIAALGFSAGGHLALLLATLDPPDGLEAEGADPAVSSKVQTAVSFFGPTDMERLPQVGAGGDLREAVGTAALATLLGPAFRADPSSMSPVRYLDGGDPPMLLFQGTRDPLVPAAQAQLFLDRMTEVGVRGKAVLVAGAGHGFLEPELGDSVEATLRWLDRHLRPDRYRSRVPEILRR